MEEKKELRDSFLNSIQEAKARLDGLEKELSLKEAINEYNNKLKAVVEGTKAEFIDFINSGKMIPTQYIRHLEYFKQLGYIR